MFNLYSALSITVASAAVVNANPIDDNSNNKIKSTVNLPTDCVQSILECTTHHMGTMNSNLRRMLGKKYPTSKDAQSLCIATSLFTDCLENIPECHDNAQVKSIIQEVGYSREHCKVNHS